MGTAGGQNESERVRAILLQVVSGKLSPEEANSLLIQPESVNNEEPILEVELLSQHLNEQVEPACSALAKRTEPAVLKPALEIHELRRRSELAVPNKYWAAPFGNSYFPRF